MENTNTKLQKKKVLATIVHHHIFSESDWFSVQQRNKIVRRYSLFRKNTQLDKTFLENYKNSSYSHDGLFSLYLSITFLFYFVLFHFFISLFVYYFNVLPKISNWWAGKRSGVRCSFGKSIKTVKCFCLYNIDLIVFLWNLMSLTLII